MSNKAVDSETGISVRFIKEYDVSKDQQITPWDVQMVRDIWREEGRRDILRQIAAMPEHYDNHECAFCGNCSCGTPQELHKPDCLWLQAQAVKAPEPVK